MTEDSLNRSYTSTERNIRAVAILLFVLGLCLLLAGVNCALSPNWLGEFFYGFSFASFGCYLTFSAFSIRRNINITTLEHFSLAIACAFFIVSILFGWTLPWLTGVNSFHELPWASYFAGIWIPIILSFLIFIVLRMFLLKLLKLQANKNSGVLSIVYFALGLRLAPFILIEHSLPAFILVLCSTFGIFLILLAGWIESHRSDRKLTTGILFFLSLVLFGSIISLSKSWIQGYMEWLFLTGMKVHVWGSIFISIAFLRFSITGRHFLAKRIKSIT